MLGRAGAVDNNEGEGHAWCHGPQLGTVHGGNNCMISVVGFCSWDIHEW